MNRSLNRPPPAQADHPDETRGAGDLAVRRLLLDMLDAAPLDGDLPALVEWVHDHGNPSGREG